MHTHHSKRDDSEYIILVIHASSNEHFLFTKIVKRTSKHPQDWQKEIERKKGILCKWSKVIHDTQSAQDEHNIYVIMKTMCPPGYHHKAIAYINIYYEWIT